MAQQTSTKKKGPKQPTDLVETAVVQTLQPEEGTSKSEEAKAESTPKPEIAKPLTMAYLNSELEALKQIVSEHGQQIAELQEALSRKRKAVPNGKVQIQDKQTGKVYPSKNNCYQTLLKSGELKDLVDKGVFGDDPAKNSFGWYALVRALPDRFEEVKTKEVKIGAENQA